MVTIKNSSANSSDAFSQASGSYGVLPDVLYWAEVKRYLSSDDEWQYVPWLEPVECVEAAAPEVSSARFRYQYGQILRNQASSYDTFYPINARNWYVRILMQRYGEDPQAIWYGIFADDQGTLDGSSVGGTQILRAYGVAQLLDRIKIDRAYVYDVDPADPLGERTKMKIDWVPTHNRRTNTGRRGVKDRKLKGNCRGTEPSLFASDGAIWSNYNVLRYLLDNFWYEETRLGFQIIGQWETLADIKDVHDFDGDTIWGAIKKLVDRRYGISAVAYIDDSDYSLIVRIFTLTDVPITVGESTLPANRMQTDFTVPSEAPYTHLVGEVPFRTTSLSDYNVIKVRSAERIKVMLTLSYLHGNLQKDWASTSESAYKACAGVAANANQSVHEARDMFRARDKFKHVYTRHRIIDNWGWSTRGVKDSSENFYVSIKANEDGTIQKEPQAPNIWNSQKKAFRDLPLLVGYDYSVSPPTTTLADDSDPGFQSMKVFVRYAWGVDVVNITGNNNPVVAVNEKWAYVDQISAVMPAVPNSGFHPLENEIGFQLNTSYNHLFALKDWAGALDGTKDPKLDYHRLACTVFIETDQKLQVVYRSPLSTVEPKRTMVIEVPDVEYWYAQPETVIDINDDGQLVLIPKDNQILRDDSDVLRAVAAKARAWYMGRRQAVQIPINDIGIFVPIGTMLTAINSVYGRDPVRTCVTARKIDFDSRTTVIETGFHAIDLMPRTRY